MFLEYYSIMIHSIFHSNLPKNVILETCHIPRYVWKVLSFLYMEMSTTQNLLKIPPAIRPATPLPSL